MMRAIYPPSISAHAYQRFRERVGEATHKQIDDYLLTAKMREWLSWGVCRVINYKGLNIAVNQGAIVTVVVAGPGASRRNLSAMADG